MRRESAKERAEWTALIEGRKAKENKYGVAPKEERGKYASRHEAEEAAKLWALAAHGKIRDFEEQKRLVLVPGNGKLRPVVWVADFFYVDERGAHWVDAKGYKTPIYRLKKRLAALLLGIEIEEV